MSNYLLVAAQRAGIPLGQTFNKGMTTKELGQVLYSAIQYGQEISQTSSLVARAQYG